VPHTPPPPKREELAPEERADYDRVIARQKSYGYEELLAEIPHDLPLLAGDEVQPYFGALLNSPPVAAQISEFGAYFRSRGAAGNSYGHTDREWIDLTLTHDLRCRAVLYHHMLDAVAVGIAPGSIKALREGRVHELTAQDRELVEYVRSVVGGSVTSEAYRGIERRFGTRGAIEYTAFIAFLLMTLRLIQALDIPEKSDAEVDELLAGIIAGTVTIPGPEDRIPEPRSVRRD
jgi:hypothetical protein